MRVVPQLRKLPQEPWHAADGTKGIVPEKQARFVLTDVLSSRGNDEIPTREGAVGTLTTGNIEVEYTLADVVLIKAVAVVSDDLNALPDGGAPAARREGRFECSRVVFGGRLDADPVDRDDRSYGPGGAGDARELMPVIDNEL